jgi:hypothetical protein
MSRNDLAVIGRMWGQRRYRKRQTWRFQRGIQRIGCTCLVCQQLRLVVPSEFVAFLPFVVGRSCRHKSCLVTCISEAFFASRLASSLPPPPVPSPLDTLAPAQHVPHSSPQVRQVRRSRRSPLPGINCPPSARLRPAQADHSRRILPGRPKLRLQRWPVER